jgi:rare lipoprotein A
MLAATLATGGVASAKTPGETYCFNGTCHRVKSIAETEALVGAAETLATSYYDTCDKDPLNPCGLTSSGEVFRADLPDNAASPIYPDGTLLLVWAPETHEAAVLRINNAGPYWGERKLDVSRAAAERLGFMDRGVTNLEVRVIDAPVLEEATFKAGRTYDPVPGYLGKFQSLDAAHAAMAAVMGLEAITASVLAPLTGGAMMAVRAEAAAAPAPSPVVAPPPPPAPARAAPPAPQIEAKPAPAPAAAARVAAVADETPRAAPRSSKKRTAEKPRRNDKRIAAKSRKAGGTRVARLDKPTRAGKRSAPTRIARARPAPPARTTSARAIAPNDMSMFSRYRTSEHRPPAERPQSPRRTVSRTPRSSSSRDT